MSLRHNKDSEEPRDEIPKEIESDEDNNSEDEEEEEDEEVEYDDEKVDFPNPWRLSIMQTLERLSRENDETPENVLKEPHFSEFVEELQKNVKSCVQHADAFSSDSTYKIIMKHFAKLDDQTNETLEAAWMDKKTHVKNRLAENLDLFGDSDDIDE